MIESITRWVMVISLNVMLFAGLWEYYKTSFIAFGIASLTILAMTHCHDDCFRKDKTTSS